MDAFQGAAHGALSAPAGRGTRLAEERAEYDVGGRAWPPPRLRPLLRDARIALERAGPVPGSAAAGEALARLSRAAGAPPRRRAGLLARLYAGPADLAEDVLLARCLARDPAGALEMAAMRRHLQDAVVPSSLPDLSLDRASCLEQLSFAVLWAEPHRFDGVRATFDHFRAARYVPAYRAHHEEYRLGMARLARELEDAGRRAAALARLNTLQGLGRPLGRDALVELAALQDVSPCARREPLPDPAVPLCECGFVMGRVTPREQVEEAVRRVGRALTQQMGRLSTVAVRRILALPTRGREDERLARFLQVVQASDVGGLAQVLDDDLLAFLRELLAAGPTPEAGPVLRQLIRAFPVVGAGEVEGATAEFQRLLREALDEERRASPRRTPVVRLAPAPARRPRA